MKKVFIDTSAFLALFNRSDEWHVKAREIELSLKKDRCIWVTTEFIILELADALCNVYWRSLTIGFIEMNF